jgi:ribonuclease E
MIPNKTLETPNYRLERLKHDDPRLDNLQASYHMAEEVEDPTTVTRRTHERANKQEPVIKGVLPDAPAPIAEPKPIPVAKPAEPVARKPVAAPAPQVPAPAESGFMGWLKSLFGSAPAPVAAPAPAAEPKKEERREGRGGEGRGDGRGGRGGRGRDGERRDGRRGDGRGRDGEQRREGEPRRERAEAEGQQRNAEGGRGRDGEQRRGDRQERGEGRDGRGEGRDSRGGDRRREPRVDGEQRTGAEGVNAPVQPQGEGATAEQRQERGARGERGEGRRERGGDGRRERGDRGDGQGRRERGPREQAPAEGQEAAALAGAAGSVGAVSEMGDQQAPATDAVLESHTHQDARARDGQEGDERRDRRSRDRYGRDRRERGDRQPREDGTAPAAEGATPSEPPSMQQDRPRYPTGFVSDDAERPPERAMERPAERIDVKAPAAQPAANGLPKVRPFELPVTDLVQVAEGSGLQWVNSDAEKIAAAQAAMAAEPKPVRVPRERPPVVVVDEGPLVLVETRRDLTEMKLPFEQRSLPLQ